MRQVKPIKCKVSILYLRMWDRLEQLYQFAFANIEWNTQDFYQ